MSNANQVTLSNLLYTRSDADLIILADQIIGYTLNLTVAEAVAVIRKQYGEESK